MSYVDAFISFDTNASTIIGIPRGILNGHSDHAVAGLERWKVKAHRYTSRIYHVYMHQRS